jgi:hypothetical protein
MRIDATTSHAQIASRNISATSKLYAELAIIKISDREEVSETDACMMLFLTAGLIALQLRREQKRAGRASLGRLLTLTVSVPEPLSSNQGEPP